MELTDLPYMLFTDSKGQIYDHPYYRMAGFSGSNPLEIDEEDLIQMPQFSKLFFIPDCPPIGLDPDTGEYEIVREIEIDGKSLKCFAVAAFPEPGFVRSHLPAVDYQPKRYHLPMWGYTAVGFKEDNYYLTGFRVEYNERWDPKNYNDENLVPAIDRFCKGNKSGPLAEHLINCAVNNHCFAAKNFFLERWEAPLPVSRSCNAACLGCLSLQQDDFCESSHQRISFRPDKDEIVSIAVSHLNIAQKAIVSFGQGCEGEPLTEYQLITDSIKEIRKRSEKGTINLNTNGSNPEKVRGLAESGLDSIRISLNSARSDLYHAYYRPRDYHFLDVVNSITMAKKMGLFTMINYLVFPGITDQVEEMDAFCQLIASTGVDFIHFKNLNIDPQLYLEKVPKGESEAIGMKNMVSIFEREFPDLKIGYFNQTVR